jgi:hypothetical protein
MGSVFDNGIVFENVIGAISLPLVSMLGVAALAELTLPLGSGPG